MNASRSRLLLILAIIFANGPALFTSGCTRSSDEKTTAIAAPPDAAGDQVPVSPTTARTDALQFAAAAAGSQAIVTGTSTLHDWTVKGGDVQGDVKFSGQWKSDVASPIQIEAIHLTIPVKSLKSTEGSGMDDKMYEALDLKNHPAISYTITHATLKSPPTAGDAGYHFDATGELTISGKTRTANLDLRVLPHGHDQVTISTETSMKMSDFGVTPPTAMLGMIKSGDVTKVKVTWELVGKSG